MSIRSWLWLGTVLNAIIVLPAAFMAFSAIDLATAYPDSSAAIAVSVLISALPLFSLLAPFAAWRIHGKRAQDRNAVLMMAAPLVYAAFLAFFLFTN